MELERLGWNRHFSTLANDHCGQALQPARVAIVDRDHYTLLGRNGEFTARLTGRFRHNIASHADFPCVGDWVCIETPDDDFTMISDVLPRKSFLRRKTPGKHIDYQMIGANIDVAIIVMACHYDFNLRRLERYLVMVREGRIEPWLALTKTDLVSDDELQQLIASIQEMVGDICILPISNTTGDGIDALQLSMLAGLTYCLIGSSGVGKTSLINRLTDQDDYLTASVSATGEGRHTTVRRQLIMLEQGAMLIDTPGMRELGLIGATEGVDAGFADILLLAERCRFGNCSHVSEPGCAVRQALASGELSREHFENYLKLKKENEYHDLSYVEKRRKDRAFGKMVSSVMKEKHRHKR